jgi:hypothetical protein
MVSRRRIIAAIGTGGLTVSAGCLTTDGSDDDSAEKPGNEATKDPKSTVQTWFDELDDMISERNFERVEDVEVAGDETAFEALSDLDGDLAPESIRAEVDHLLHSDSPLTGTFILFFLVGIEGNPVEIHPPSDMPDLDTTVVEQDVTATELADRLPEELALSPDVRTEVAAENAVVRATFGPQDTSSKWLVATESGEWLIVTPW